ncbi:putative signal transduction histidine kinase [Caenispirillum salinarum AK4]|uniref:histidine kinase n=1 Tax=Caenispirillum salinarum AK4 TaxID=1238182 RepID=K9HEJ1_9PROT|nr:PAS domain-containing protein [Caenispirillum salinarum]EKV28923.1 putative signal transduction histidine kinase [Caenispirillum salinarum AK4]
MGALIRSHDWAATPLGHPEDWPVPLKTAAGMMLRATTPVGIYWGPDFALLYNDAWRDLIADKHPAALGRPAREVFPEIWGTIGPLFAGVLAGNGSTHAENQFLPIRRHGRIEDAWFDYSFMEIPLEDGTIGGILNTATETTNRVVAERSRSKAEAALRTSEARARNIVDSIADGLMTFDADWRITFVNPRGEEIIRPMVESGQAILGKVFWDIFPGVDDTAFGAPYRRTMTERVATTVEAYYPPLDAWFYARCYPHAEGVALYFLDITARVRAEEELSRAHAMIDGITQGTQDLIAALDTSYRTLYFNDAYGREYEKLWGHRIRIGENLLEPLAPWPEEQRKAQEIWHRALAGEAFNVIMEFGPSKADTRVYDLRFSPVRDRDGHQIGAAHIFRDVTDQKTLERALRESEERFRALVTSTSNVVYRMSADWSEMRDLEGRGFMADTEEPRQNWMDAYIPPDDRPQVTAAIDEAISGKTIFDQEHRVHRVDGSVGWMRSRAVPLLGDDGEIVEWFGAAIDVTDRKMAEEHQTMLMAELDHRVKNVLAVVQAIAQQSLGRSGGNDGTGARAFVGRIEALAQSHALLAASRWEGARFRDLIDDAVGPYVDAEAPRIRMTGPDLRVTPKAAQTLSLALHELVTNAAKYGALSTPDGRVTIDWSLHDDDGRRLVLRWAEHGGPPIEEPPERKGFGSRLIEQAVAFELSGTVTLDFARDGLKVAFDLPLHRLRAPDDRDGPAARRTPKPAAGHPEALKGRRILLVEDQHLVAEEMGDALRAAGCSVIGPAPTLGHALRSADVDALDGAVLDINLNEEFVWPAARVLRERDIPFVFTTGYSETITFPPELSDAPRIEKPAPPHRLISVLAALVGGG